jgi:small subunit ribosomal protein S16
MAVKLRLARHGSKGHAYYRIVAADGTCPRDGRYLEQLGTYDPAFSPPAVKLQRERVQHWLSVGARPSDTVRSLLRRFMAGEDVAAPARAAYVPMDLPPEPQREPEMALVQVGTAAPEVEAEAAAPAEAAAAPAEESSDG